MALKIYIDGKLFDKEQAKISVFDHGLLYGDGVFEGIRAYKGKIFKFDEHIARLYNSAKAVMIEIPLTQAEFKKAITDTMAANNLSDAYIRAIVTRGFGDLGIDPRKCPKPSVIIITATIQLYPEELYRKGLELITVSTRRISDCSLSPRIKSCNYLNNVLGKLEALRSGCIEGVMLNSKGEVAECTADNIFIVTNGKLKTPPPEAGILEGITRNAILGIAKEIGLDAREAVLTCYDLYTADECFLTGTGAEVIPVIAIDARKIGGGKPGPTTLKLLAKFRELTAQSGA